MDRTPPIVAARRTAEQHEGARSPVVQRSFSARAHGWRMTFAPTPTADRCDRILALIDEALGETFESTPSNASTID
jgi:hypothetical protein